MEQSNYSVNGKNYLLFKFILTSRTVGRFENRLEKYKGILQSFDTKYSFWDGKKYYVSVLIPEQYALEFSKGND